MCASTVFTVCRNINMPVSLFRCCRHLPGGRALVGELFAEPSRHLRLRHYRNTQTLQPQEIIHNTLVSAMQFQDRDLPATPPHRVRKNPHTSGTARQTRTSLKPYCCSTHLNVFKFQIVSVQRFSLLKPLFQPSTH